MMSAFQLFDLHALARVSTLRIMDCLVEGTVLAMFAALMLRLARRESSASRFALWLGALIAIASLPLIDGWTGQHTSLPAGSAGVFMLPGSLAAYGFAAWVLIASFGLLNVARSFWHLHVLRESCEEVALTDLDARLRATIESQSGGRSVAFCTSDRVHVPTAIGLVRPAVVIPVWVMEELPPDELNQILLHELAHLRRWDDWTNLAQKLVKAVFFFHPAVWWIEKKISLEREMACDEAVVEATARPRAYAECLTHLAERTLVQRSVALAQAALGKIRQTTHRVAAILELDQNAGRTAGTGWKPAAGLMAAVTLACVVGFSRAPRLIGFSDAGQNSRAVIAAGADIRLPAGVSVVNATAVLHAPAVPGRQAKLSVPTHRTEKSVASHEVETQVPELSLDSFLQRANFVEPSADVPVAFTETLFVVIQGNDSGFPDRPGFQIQLWRVMVLHPAVDPDANRLPTKKT